VTYHAH